MDQDHQQGPVTDLQGPVTDPQGSVTHLMQTGGDEAFWKLYTRFVVDNQSLQDAIKRWLPSDRAGEPVDILSDAFSRLWQKAEAGEIDQFSDRDNLLSLLTTYAKNQASSARRKHRPKGDTSVYGTPSDGAARLGDQNARQTSISEFELQVARESIEAHLASLESDQLRSIVIMAANGKSQAEIANELGYATAKSIERAFDKIRKTWMCDYILEFENQWADGTCPDFKLHFNQFASAGRWLMRELAEIEIHERLRRGMPVSLQYFRTRAGDEYASCVEKIFLEQLFFDEVPSPQSIEKLRNSLDPWTAQVLELKLNGNSNDAIARRLKCSASNILDAMQFLRGNASSESK